jgi:hypothetical protein
MRILGTDNKTYYPLYEIGNVVRINGRGWTYPAFDDAFKLLDVKYERIDKNLSNDQVKKMNWLITNVLIFIRKGRQIILYSIKNNKGQFLVISEEGIESKRNIPFLNIDNYKNNKKDKIQVLTYV